MSGTFGILFFFFFNLFCRLIVQLLTRTLTKYLLSSTGIVKTSPLEASGSFLCLRIIFFLSWLGEGNAFEARSTGWVSNISTQRKNEWKCDKNQNQECGMYLDIAHRMRYFAAKNFKEYPKTCTVICHNRKNMKKINKSFIIAIKLDRNLVHILVLHITVSNLMYGLHTWYPG